ncbi:MAG: hypothetical protein WC789_13870 [Lentisphaeria bacterium]|jgi:hypothetical protein
MKPKKTAPLHIAPGHLVCPTCLELLSQEDIEDFGHCPYCDHRFTHNDDLDDFLLAPVVEQWMWMQQNQPGPGEIQLQA